MGNNSKIDSIVNNIFSKVEINEKENYKQWQLDKDKFQEELEIAINEFDNETRKLILLRLEKDAESGKVEFYDSAGNINLKKISKVTKNIAKEVTEKNTVNSNIEQTSNNTNLGSTQEKEQRIEEIKQDFASFMSGWSKEEQDIFAKSMDEALKKKEEVEKLVESGISQEDAERKVGVTDKEQYFIDINNLQLEINELNSKITNLENGGSDNKKLLNLKEQLNKKIEEYNIYKKDYEDKLDKIKKLMDQGMSREEAEETVGWKYQEKALENNEKNEFDRQVTSYSGEGKSKEVDDFSNTFSKKIAQENFADSYLDEGNKTHSNTGKESDISKSSLVTKDDILNSIDIFTEALSGSENSEELQSEIHKIIDSAGYSPAVSIILERMSQNNEYIQNLNDEDKRNDIAMQLFDLQEQIKEMDFENKREDIYSLLGMEKITDKEMAKLIKEKQVEMDTSAIEAQKQQKAANQENIQPVPDTDIDSSIINGDNMAVDPEWENRLVEAQQRGEDLESTKTLVQIVTEKEQQDREEHEQEQRTNSRKQPKISSKPSTLGEIAGNEEDTLKPKIELVDVDIDSQDISKSEISGLSQDQNELEGIDSTSKDKRKKEDLSEEHEEVDMQDNSKQQLDNNSQGNKVFSNPFEEMKKFGVIIEEIKEEKEGIATLANEENKKDIDELTLEN